MMSRRLRTAIAVMLAVVLAAFAPLQAYAAQNTGKTYIKELYLVEDSHIEEYRNKEGFIVYGTPLFENVQDNNGTKIWLVAETTKKANEAITDIRALRMNDDFSFDLYNEYLDKLNAGVSVIVDEWFAEGGPIDVFKSKYKAGKPEAKSAYDLLNCFYDDDVENMRLGELFISDKLTKDVLHTLLLEGNLDVVELIKKALAIACSRNDDGETFIDVFSSEEYDNLVHGHEIDISVYENDALMHLSEIEAIRDAVTVYRLYKDDYESMSEEEFREYMLDIDYDGAETEEEYIEAVINNRLQNNYEKVLLGEKYTELFEDYIYYTYNLPGASEDIWDQYQISLLDLFMMENYYPEDVPEDEYEFTRQEHLIMELEYMIGAMDPCTYAMLDIGIVTLMTIAMEDEDAYSKLISDMKKDKETDEDVKKCLNDGISAFYGIDRNVFTKGMVAMTGVASDAIDKDDTWQRSQDEENLKANKKATYYTLMIASGATCGASLAAFTTYAAVTYANYGIVVPASGAYVQTGSAFSGPVAKFVDFIRSLFSNQIKIAGRTSMGTVVNETLLAGESHSTYDLVGGAATRSSATLAAGIVSGVVFVVSLAMFVYTLVQYLTAEEPELINKAYEEIPAYICDYRTAEYIDETLNRNVTVSNYIYYKGVANPDTPRTESLHPSSEKVENKKLLPENKGNVMDIYNWELRGNRQWVCLYTTKSVYAGMPIEADSISIDNEKRVANKATVKQFEGDQTGFDFSAPYNNSIDSQYTTNKISKSEKERLTMDSTYIHYHMDAKAAYLKSGEEKTIGALTGSVLASPTTWAVSGVMLALGLVGGIFIGKKCIKKKETEV